MWGAGEEVSGGVQDAVSCMMPFNPRCTVQTSTAFRLSPARAANRVRRPTPHAYHPAAVQ